MAMWLSFVDAFTGLKKKSGIFRVHLIEATLTCICVPCLALQITQEWFSKLVGDRVEPSDVFLAFTVDQGLNVVNAIEALNVPGGSVQRTPLEHGGLLDARYCRE